MTYSPEEKKRIEVLIAAFSEYIRNSKSLDIVYSEKFGFLVVYSERRNGDGTFVAIQDYDYLLNYLCREVAIDFIIELTDDEKEADYEEAIAKSSAILEPILNSLGEDKERCMNELKKSLKNE